MLTVGEPGPWFSAATPSDLRFDFDTTGGRYVLLAFPPPTDHGRAAALQAVTANRGLFDDQKISCFVVTSEDAATTQMQDLQGLHWLLDPEGEVRRLYQVDDQSLAEPTAWILLDPTLRIAASGPMSRTQAMMRVLANLPPVDAHAATTLHAPVLLLPRVFEPDLSRRLIELFEASSAGSIALMQDLDGRPAAMMDGPKNPREVTVTDLGLIALLQERIERRIFPELTKSFQFKPTRIERYVVTVYDAEAGGVLPPRRGNTTTGAAHRRFACSINLNDDFQGGDLRFPEFGGQTYRPPLNGALAFSCSLLHERTPVTLGRRYAFEPFIHDEAAQAVLDTHRRGQAGD